jgi:hypothetical protein
MRGASNRLKVLVVLAAAMSLAGCEALTGKPNVYKMPVARAYQKLMAATIKPSGNGPFHRLEIETSGKPNASVEWTAKGSQDGAICSASLKPLDAEQTRIDISCKGGEGVTDGLMAKLTRVRVIELVDATLRDRPFDPKKTNDGSTAAFWPKDVIDHGTIGTAAAKALELERRMAEETRRISPDNR